MKLVLASTNPGKSKEMRAIFAKLSFLEILERPLAMKDVDEVGSTLEENAGLKAKAVANFAGLPAIADDTGLFIDALDGAPGVYSARYAGEFASDQDNVAKVLCDLAELPNKGGERRAHFSTAAFLAFPDKTELDDLCACGSAHGHLIETGRGGGGFGYDVIFVPDDGDGRTFAEMDSGQKDAISHRGKAFRKLTELIEAKLL